jgi:hypothetical protein
VFGKFNLITTLIKEIIMKTWFVVFLLCIAMVQGQNRRGNIEQSPQPPLDPVLSWVVPIGDWNYSTGSLANRLKEFLSVSLNEARRREKLESLVRLHLDLMGDYRIVENRDPVYAQLMRGQAQRPFGVSSGRLTLPHGALLLVGLQIITDSLGAQKVQLDAIQSGETQIPMRAVATYRGPKQQGDVALLALDLAHNFNDVLYAKSDQERAMLYTIQAAKAKTQSYDMGTTLWLKHSSWVLYATSGITLLHSIISGFAKERYLAGSFYFVTAATLGTGGWVAGGMAQDFGNAYNAGKQQYNSAVSAYNSRYGWKFHEMP